MRLSATSRPLWLDPYSTAMSCEQACLLNKIIFSDSLLRAAYSGTALAFRDRLIVEWNKTQQRHTFADQKRVYCMTDPLLAVLRLTNLDLSLEFLMGRALDNALLNVGLKDVARGSSISRLHGDNRLNIHRRSEGFGFSNRRCHLPRARRRLR